MKFFAKMKSWWVWIMAAICLLIGLTSFAYLDHDEKQLQANEQALRTSGSLEATEVTTAFKMPGKIAKIMVDEGDTVQAGQVIAMLESREVEAEYQNATAAVDLYSAKLAQAQTSLGIQSQKSDNQVASYESLLREAEAALAVTEKTFQRTSELFDQGVVSKQAFDEMKAKYDSALERVNQARSSLNIARTGEKQVILSQDDISAARASVDQAKAAVAKSGAYVDNMVLEAPIGGVITLRTVDIGEMVGAGTPVMVISDLSNTWVKIYIDEQKIGQVYTGQSADVTFDAFKNRHFSGKVVSVNPSGEFATRKAINELRDHDIKTFAVKVQIPNQDGLLKAGMTAYVELISASQRKK